MKIMKEVKILLLSAAIILMFFSVLGGSKPENGFSEIQITTNTGKQRLPVIHEKGIAWTDYRSDGYGDIYFYDFDTGEERPISNQPNIGEHTPAIYKNKIV
jgi:beta propeller repeat protein